LLAVMACGEGVEASAVRQPVLRGVRDATSTSVVWLLSEGPQPMACTGTIIADDLVLTARHCVSDLSAGPARCDDRRPWGAALQDGGLSVVLDDVVSGDSEVWPAVPVLLGPDDAEQCGNDLALVRTSRPLGRPPVALRLDAPPRVGEPVSVVGYGDSAGPETSGARRRRDGLRVMQVGRTTTASGATRTTESEWVIDEGPCAGDSGGPAFDADGVQLGVMSRGNQATCQSMIYTRLDRFADGLRRYLPVPDAGQPAPQPPVVERPAVTEVAGPAAGCSTSPGAGLVALLLGLTPRRRRTR
jgi:hypothetical protein